MTKAPESIVVYVCPKCGDHDAAPWTCIDGIKAVAVTYVREDRPRESAQPPKGPGLIVPPSYPVTPRLEQYVAEAANFLNTAGSS